jgi:hypothetical protein
VGEMKMAIEVFGQRGFLKKMFRMTHVVRQVMSIERRKKAILEAIDRIIQNAQNAQTKMLLDARDQVQLDVKEHTYTLVETVWAKVEERTKANGGDVNVEADIGEAAEEILSSPSALKEVADSAGISAEVFKEEMEAVHEGLQKVQAGVSGVQYTVEKEQAETRKEIQKLQSLFVMSKEQASVEDKALAEDICALLENAQNAKLAEGRQHIKAGNFSDALGCFKQVIGAPTAVSPQDFWPRQNCCMYTRCLKWASAACRTEHSTKRQRSSLTPWNIVHIRCPASVCGSFDCFMPAPCTKRGNTTTQMVIGVKQESGLNQQKRRRCCLTSLRRKRWIASKNASREAKSFGTRQSSKGRRRRLISMKTVMERSR